MASEEKAKYMFIGEPGGSDRSRGEESDTIVLTEAGDFY